MLSLTAFTVTAGPAHAAGWSSGLTYVLMTGHGEHSMMSGSTDDYNRARAMRAGNAPLLYVRQDGAAYVIRDPAILRRAEQIMQPQQELGRRQGELGRQQGALGRQQGALGAEQGRLGRLMADARVREMHDLGQQQGELAGGRAPWARSRPRSGSARPRSAASRRASPRSPSPSSARSSTRRSGAGSRSASSLGRAGPG